MAHTIRNTFVPERLEQITAWLKTEPDFAGVYIRPASADASFRRYFRARTHDASYIVMDAPPDKEDMAPFLKVDALLLGIGLVLLVEYLDPSFFNTKELENALDFPVLVSIPVIMTDQDLKRAFVKRVVSAAALVSMACVLLCALYFLWRMDPMAMSLTAS